MHDITFLVHCLLCLSKKKTTRLTEKVTWVLNMFHFYLRLSYHLYMVMTIQEELDVS
jgi:hypothetical protein